MFFQGIAQTAQDLIATINKTEKVQTFLKDNPDFGIVVTGHSLGAGCCVLVAMILKFCDM